MGVCKRQFTTHIFVNVGMDKNVYRYVDFICHRTGQRIYKLEKDSWNKNIYVRFQNKVWIGQSVMIAIAKDFVKFKIEGKWC